MKPFRILLVVAAALGLQACSSVEPATRAAPMSGPVLSTSTAPLSVQGLNVTVPRALKVSEANLFYPHGDIVWRGEPRGDRYQQVATMFEEGMSRGIARMPDAGQPVMVNIEVTRFHALSEKARLIGGVHNIKFILSAVDATTGAVILPPREIESDLKGLGGNAALEANARGYTEKVQITEHLARVIQMELSRPGSAEQTVTIFSSESDLKLKNAI